MNQLFRWDQTGLFLLALAAGILPFAVPEVCAAALREGLTLCSGPLLLSLFPFLVVSRLLVQCPESDLLAMPFRLAAWGIGIRTPCAARVLCIGFLGGFAPAACAAAQAVRTGQLTVEEADALLPAIQTELDDLFARCPVFPMLEPELVRCRYGNDANMIGALKLFFERNPA